MKTNSYQDHMWQAHGIRVDEPECQVCKAEKDRLARQARNAVPEVSGMLNNTDAAGYPIFRPPDKARGSGLGPAGHPCSIPGCKLVVAPSPTSPRDPNTPKK